MSFFVLSVDCEQSIRSLKSGVGIDIGSSSEPCLPTVSRTVPTGAGWAYEIKHDGFRFICQRDGDCVRLFSAKRAWLR